MRGERGDFEEAAPAPKDESTESAAPLAASNTVDSKKAAPTPAPSTVVDSYAKGTPAPAAKKLMDENNEYDHLKIKFEQTIRHIK